MYSVNASYLSLGFLVCMGGSCLFHVTETAPSPDSASSFLARNMSLPLLQAQPLHRRPVAFEVVPFCCHGLCPRHTHVWEDQNIPDPLRSQTRWIKRNLVCWEFVVDCERVVGIYCGAGSYVSTFCWKVFLHFVNSEMNFSGLECI